MRNLIFTVSGQRRAVRRLWWNLLKGPKPSTSFECDGCSRSPDYWRGMMLWPAGVIHDYHYRTGVLGGTWRARQEADAYIRENIRILLRLQGCNKLSARSISWLYWGRVRVWGRSSYRHWDNPKAALPWRHRLLEAWGLRRNR